MTELKNNQVEISLRYTGSEPDRAFHLARIALTFKGFQFEDLGKPVNYQEQDGEYTTTFIGTNGFLAEEQAKPKKEGVVSTMNNAPLGQSPEGVNA